MGRYADEDYGSYPDRGYGEDELELEDEYDRKEYLIDEYDRYQRKNQKFRDSEDWD